MKEDRSTAAVDITVSLPRELDEAAGSFEKALGHIDALYRMQLSGSLSGAFTRARENKAWREIIETLRATSPGVPEPGRAGFDRDVRVLEGGIYDLYPLRAESGGELLELIVGRVFLSSGGGEGYYAGAAGALNRDYARLIEDYDRHIPLFSERLRALSGSTAITPPDALPELRCLDVFSLSGGLDVEHKPICVFFSGGGRENVSALSNLTVFINLYVNRFKAITGKIAERYISGAGPLGELSYSDTARLLLIWLRGHDTGHFMGADKLGRVMSEFDMDYMILHELKADLVSLYNLRHIDTALFGGRSLEQAYMVSMAEMLRYIRRRGYYKHPDTGSAYLTYMLLRQKGALTYDGGTGKISFDFKLLEEAVEERAGELLQIFSSGDAGRARAYVSAWGELAAVDKDGIPIACPGELREVISDTGIARNIEYHFERRN